MDDATIRRIADEVAEIKRRLANVERSPQAPRTAIRGGQFRFFPGIDDDGPVMVHGSNALDDGVGMAIAPTAPGIAWFNAAHSVSGDTDFYVGNPDDTHQALRIFNGNMLAPLISCAWQADPAVTHDSNGRAQVASGTYTRAWTSILAVCTGKLRSVVTVQLGAGVTSADARIRARIYPTGTPVTVYEETAISGSVFLGGLPWTIPDSVNSPASSPVGRVVLLEIEVRVAGGAGNVLVAPNEPVVNWPP